MNSRLAAVLVVLLAWAVIYLPALGSIAIKGEEGRRILPAMGMLQTGNYIVPEVGGNPYFRKPPLFHMPNHGKHDGVEKYEMGWTFRQKPKP